MRIVALTAAILLGGAASAHAMGGCQGWKAQQTVASAEQTQEGTSAEQAKLLKKGQAQAGG